MRFGGLDGFGGDDMDGVFDETGLQVDELAFVVFHCERSWIR